MKWKLGGCRPQIPVLSALCPQLNLSNPPKKFLGTALYLPCLKENKAGHKALLVVRWELHSRTIGIPGTVNTLKQRPSSIQSYKGSAVCTNRGSHLSSQHTIYQIGCQCHQLRRVVMGLVRRATCL
jgi:hypothetical protein